MKPELKEDLLKIYNSVKEIKQKEMEPYEREFDFSKLEKPHPNIQRMMLTSLTPLSAELAEAGKFLRAGLIKSPRSRKTRNMLEAYIEILGIGNIAPYLDKRAMADEIMTAIFFNNPKKSLDYDAVHERFTNPSPEYRLTIPCGLYLNFKSKIANRPESPIPLIDWETNDYEKEFFLNRKYLSQFIKQ